MEIDIKQFIAVRSEGLQQLVDEGVSPEDVLFYFINGQFGTSLIPFEGDFPPSYKYKARKQVLAAMLNGSLIPQLVCATRLVYFSYDVVYNVDYCFDISKNHNVTLFIIKDGNIVRRYKEYDLNYDERIDLAQL